MTDRPSIEYDFSLPVEYEFHISDLRSFKDCRRKRLFSSLMPGCMGKEPKVPYAPFFTGRAIHWTLEMFYEYGGEHHPSDIFHTWLEKELKKIEEMTGSLWPAEKEKIEEQITLIVGMMDHYVMWQKHAHGINDDENLEWIATELEFKIPIAYWCHECQDFVGLLWTEDPPPHIHPLIVAYFAGRFDGVVRRRTDDTIWLFETKTTRSIKELQRGLVFDEQAGLYSWAAQQILGKPITGIIYNLLRKKIPTIPGQLKSDGTLSLNKSIDTTLEVYWETVKDTHPTQSHDDLKKRYGDMLLLLEQKGNTFFSRYEVRRSQSEMATLVQYLLATAKEMIATDTVMYPSPASWGACNWCHFRAPCLVLNAGGDPKIIFDNEYQDRKPWDPLEGKEEGA